jgi:hypothetical protein
MKPMLCATSGPRFSKTARSCPGHGEAGRHGHHELAVSIFRRRVADDVAESPAESAQAAKPNVQADIRDASSRLSQQEHRALHPPALKVAMWCLTEGPPKGPDEVRLGDVRNLGEVWDVERLRVGTVDRVAGAQHPAIQLLHGAGHDPYSQAAQRRPGPLARLMTTRSGGRNRNSRPALITCHPPSCTSRWW